MKPLIFIVDASPGITGALVAAQREAALLSDHARFVLVLPKDSRVPKSLLTSFAEILRLPMPQLRKSARSLVAYLPALLATSLRLRRELGRRGCERVQINDFYLMHGVILRLLGFRGRILTWVRIDPSRFGFLGRLWMFAALRSSDRLIAVSRFIQRRVRKAAIPSLIYDSRQAEPLSPRRAGEPRRLVYVGNFVRGKGQDHAIAAFERIAHIFPDARLTFVGGDLGLQKNRAFRAALERQAALGPAAQQIDFGGPADDIGSIYREAFLALNFSSSESFSLTCQDASAFGLPVIATRSGGPEEIIEDGVSGFLVPVGDVLAMADRMARLLSDPGRAEEMGRNGAALVRHRFSPERFRTELLELFDLR